MTITNETWLVNINVPGYLPSYEPNDFTDFNAAAEMALDLIDELMAWNSDYTYDATPLIDAQNTNTPSEFEISMINGYGQVERVVSLTRAIN